LERTVGLESDAEWLRNEANRIFDRLNQVARNLQNPRRAEVQKAGDVALMAAELCDVLREINKRGLFKALAGDVERDLKSGSVSIDVIRADIEKIVTFERGLLTAFKLSEGAADALLTAFKESKLLREWPYFAEATFMEHVNNAIDEVCSVPNLGTVLWAKQTYKKLRKRYGMVGGLAIAAANISAVATGVAPAFASASKFVGALIALDGAGPSAESG